MTRKDFELIASVIRQLPTEIRSAVAEAFAARLGEANERFQVDRFLEACGVLEECEECGHVCLRYQDGGCRCRENCADGTGAHGWPLDLAGRVERARRKPSRVRA